MELWQLNARERVRDTLARYSWSGDALRLDELAGAFCDNGTLEVRGREPVTGRAAIVEFLTGVSPGGRPPPPAGRRIVRHVLTNTRFLELSPERALVASYFTVITELGLDHHGRYRDTLVPVRDEWLIQHRFVSTDWRSPESTMAPSVDG